MKRDFDDGHSGDALQRRASYRLWSGINRASQDRMWSLLSEQIDADYGRILNLACARMKDGAGSLGLAKDCRIPDYQFRAPIHGQTGGYMLERGDDDLAAGVLYEAGGNIYALGQGIGRRDSKGERLVAHIRERYPALEPKRILEMGCSAGGQSTDYPPAFPDAEIHAIDLSPGMLRYAHARAAALDSPVHFHQQDAGATLFEDGSFDLIVSHNMFHEVAAEHMPAILQECHRLLRPGGICIHQDVPIQTKRLDAFTQYLSEWQTENNDEPFWMDFAGADLPAIAIDAGFDASKVSSEYLEALDGPIPWYIVTAAR
jgi:SAM-dependent methyltransferase